MKMVQKDKLLEQARSIHVRLVTAKSPKITFNADFEAMRKEAAIITEHEVAMALQEISKLISDILQIPASEQ